MSKVWKQKQGLFCVLERVAESQLTPETGYRRGRADPAVGSLHTAGPGPRSQDEAERPLEESLSCGRQHAKGWGSPSSGRNGQEAVVSGQMDVRDTGPVAPCMG